MTVKSDLPSFETLEGVFNVFLAANFAGYTTSDSLYKNGNGLVVTDRAQILNQLTLDFVRPHPCINHVLDVVHDELSPTLALLKLKVLRIYQQCMESECASLESDWTQLNNTIAQNYCEPHLSELEQDLDEFLDLFRVKTLDAEATTTTKLDHNMECLNRKQFLEWLFINFSIRMDASLYHNASKFLNLGARFVGVKFDLDVIKTTQSDPSKPTFTALIPTELPKVIENKDDTVLEHVQLDEIPTNSSELSADQMACIMAAALLEQRQDPVEELRFEQMDALCSEIIRRRPGFMTMLGLLQTRSEAERRNTRRVERACQQMEAVVDLLENRTGAELNQAEMEHRVQDLFIAMPLRPVWKVKKFYAKVLMSLALTSEALTVYEQIHDWKAVVEGYQALNMKEKALKLLETLRNEHPTDPHYLTLIGEIRRDEKLLEQVLEMTQDKYAKAHKVLGMMYMEAKNYNKAFKHFKRVFQLMPLSVQSVYNYGVAAWEIGEMKDAMLAFHHTTCIDPDHYKAWNNLAATCLASNQKQKAANVLKQGLHVYRESFQMWTNLYEIAAELPHKRDCFLALRQLLAFKQAADQFNPKPLLKVVLAHTAAPQHTLYPAPPVQDPLDPQDLQLLVEVLDEVHERVTLDPMTLRLMANLNRPATEETDIARLEKFIQLMDLAERRELGAGKLQKNPDYLNTLNSLMDSHSARLRHAELLGKSAEAGKKLLFFRLRPIINNIEREFGEKLEEAENEKLNQLLQNAKQLLATLK